MQEPSAVLTMVSHTGETHVEREERFAREAQARLMAFIVSPEVREAMKVLCRDVINEELHAIEAEALRYAEMYEPHSDGRNTFTIFADTVRRRQAEKQETGK